MDTGNRSKREGRQMRTASENAFSVAQTSAGFDAPRLSLVTDSARWSGQRDIHLTPRQRDVLALLCEGLPNKLICRRLNISSGTVKAHISSILRELGVSSRLQAVVAARESGLLLADYEAAE